MAVISFNIEDHTAQGLDPNIGHVVFTPTRIHTNSGGGIGTMKPFTIKYDKSFDVELANTGAEWLWKISVNSPTPIVVGYYAITNNTSFANLIAVEPDNSWWVKLNQLISMGGGPAGKDGKDGKDGVNGKLTTLVGGTVTKLPPGSNPTAEVVGTLTSKVLNLGLVTGDPGKDGSNVLPTNTAIAQAIRENGETKTELNAAIVEQAGGLLTEGLGIPSYAPAILAGAYDRRLNAYNLKPSNTRKWAVALAKARTGTGVARLNFYGDSLTMGGTLADSDQESFVPRVKQLLRASSGGLTAVTEGVAFTYGPAGAGTAGSRDSTDSRVAYPADAVAATAGGLFDYCVRLIPGTTGLTFTPNEPCDGFNVYFGIDTGNASFTVQIDSGATVSQDAAGTPQRVHMSTFSAGSLGNHVLKIGNVVAPGSVAILAVEATTGTTGIRVTRGGLSAQKWADLRSQKTTGYSSSQTQAKIGASLSVLMLGANDYLQQTPLVDVEVHARQNIVNALLLGDVMLAVSPPLSNILTIPWFSYAGILWKLADEYDLPLIDLTQRWGSHAAMSTFYNDNVHPKPEGHWDMAQAFTNAITSV